MSKVFVYDEFSPEDVAMMQALYSRSAESVVKHVEKVRESGSGKFMEQFYVGYGHSSIADCGSTTIFIEDVSILADKAVQDWRLYNGQETSTRYIDMSKRDIIDPISSKVSQAILRRWMDFYQSAHDEVVNDLIARFPLKQGDNDKTYRRAVDARSFDILRSFLPAGITTQLSWHTNLRQAWDHLAVLRRHPLPEVCNIAERILLELKKKYPNSFGHIEAEEQQLYRELISKNYSYFAPPKRYPEFSVGHTFSLKKSREYSSIFGSHPPKTSLPWFLGDLGSITFRFLLDYGSFRDIQRHRSGICRMPLLTTEFGFHPWYLGELPDSTRRRAIKLILEQEKRIQKLPCSPEIRQYYIPLGYQVGCHMTFDLPSAVYVAELRSGNAVHPTLRTVAKKMGKTLQKLFPTLALHCDFSAGTWDVSRGNQTIRIRGKK